ncbi:MAG: hypothetical protein LBR66_07290 [Candidatus Symbiothrix sp.]|jgi:phosphate-selective porin|nr:hypothetical protein [Candidatus Symbiothrix sp.]
MKKIFVLLCVVCLCLYVEAQEIKWSGFVQTQYQYGEKDASLKIGAPNENRDEAFQRIGIRRGRIKLTCREQLLTAVVQANVSENGFTLKDASIQVKEPWLDMFSLKAGLMECIFGYEVNYSSALQEALESSTLTQMLFPDERDMGLMFAMQAPASSWWRRLKVQFGWFTGNGVKWETDSKRDFIGRMQWTENIGNFRYGLGASVYHGNVFQATDSVFRMQNHRFVLNDNPRNRGQFARREYFGMDAQIAFKTSLGWSQIRAEWISGQQPGSSGSSKSGNELPPTKASYLRPFAGGYLAWIQNLGALPCAIVLRYDSYDPNKEMAGNEVGATTDLRLQTFGLGAYWDILPHLRVAALYEWKNRETNALYAALHDDVFTLRLQYSF